MSLMSETGAVNYNGPGAYSEPSLSRLFVTRDRPEPVVHIQLQDEAHYPPGTEHGEDDESEESELEEEGLENMSINVAVGPDKAHCSWHSDTAQSVSAYSRELVIFYLYGRIKPAQDRFRSEALGRRLSLAKQMYTNIPLKLQFSYSTVAIDKIGVSASQHLPQDTKLGPYSGENISENGIKIDMQSQWLWEVYEHTGALSYIDGSDPRYGNWMFFIQCARTKEEQNLKLAQHVTQESSKLYFVATRSIEAGQELLVWYDWKQYSLYFGLPTGLKGTHSIASDDESVCSPSREQYHEPSSPGMCQQEPADSYTPAKTTSECTDDSGIFTYEQESDFRVKDSTPTSPNTNKSFKESTYPHHLQQPLLLRPPVKPAADQASLAQEQTPVTKHSPITHKLTSFGFVQPSSQLTAQFSSYMAATQDSLYSPRVSPQCVSDPWIRPGTRSHSPSPVPSITQQTTELTKSMTDISEPAWRANYVSSSSPQTHLLYGMFMRSKDGSRWKCARCERQFNSQGSLRAHARIHTGERPYKCKFCSRTFCQASTLRSHERLHTGEKPYKCGVCNRAFTQSAGLRSHLKTHMGTNRFEQ